MELKLLRAFVVLSEELHFGHAAERLCIVQPALSMQLQKLERELGVTLFERDRHSVELTALGRTFLPEAQAILAQAERAVGLVKAADAGEVGVIRLGFVSSILPFYLPELIRRLRVRYPAIELELKDMPSPEQLLALRSNRIDIGFVRLPIDDRRVTTQTVLTESFVVALPDDHPLAQAEAITPAALADIPVFFLARRFAPGYYDEVMRAFRRAGYALQVAREFGEFTTMAALISAGMGIGILPKYAMSAKYDNVAIRPLTGPDLQARVGLAWTEPESRLKQAFLDVAGETAQALATTP
ncbi:LysR family transcriptional regulator [Propionivibrio dicarboxylicus]|uniref:Transcriptional regulator, LysR family n=1 Tax=Propionivibrio dicarboxylicus TaxID=83767 RepID=A0A1G7YIL2_9RHOO|nr:LysR family transcriptional regulator [Propionivibrio dicarboxylicus]SDG96353.1 transcriptional regulator, LysR family [Propionivibrio dicarboxylicus]